VTKEMIQSEANRKASEMLDIPVSTLSYQSTKAEKDKAFIEIG